MSCLFKRLILFFVFLSIGLTIEPVFVFAGSFLVKPAKQEIILKPGDFAERKILITNNLGFNSYFLVRGIDIELPNHVGNLYLSDLLSFGNEEVFVADGSTKEITFLVQSKKETPPGGAYGYLEILAKPKPENDGEAKISASLGSVIFVRIEGPIKEEGKLLSFGLIGRQIKFTTPFSWHFSFENTGNIYLNPYGKIFLKNNLTGGQAWVDIPPQSVLPKQTRLFEASSAVLGFPGHYTATLFFNRGYNNVVDSLAISFWFVPWPLLMLTGGMFLLLLLFFKKNRKKKNVQS